MQENNSQIIIYQTESGKTKIDVRFQDETVWLTQKLMAGIKDLERQLDKMVYKLYELTEEEMKITKGNE
jgi:hypothetical protein